MSRIMFLFLLFRNYNMIEYYHNTQLVVNHNQLNYVLDYIDYIDFNYFNIVNDNDLTKIFANFFNFFFCSSNHKKIVN